MNTEADLAALRAELLELQTNGLDVKSQTDLAALRDENARLAKDLRAQTEIAEDKGRQVRELRVENARLQMELDSSCNAEELRQFRDDNARLRAAIPDPLRLLLLADWLDRYDGERGSAEHEVQDSLRRWASAGREALKS
jgi:predicted nuclease with TOPRIM domain